MKFLQKESLDNKKWFTFVELIVSLFISWIVLTGIFYFIAVNVDEIVSSNKKTEFFNEFYDFRDKILEFSNFYHSWQIIVDNASGTWSDVLLLQNIDWSEWIIVWVVAPPSVLKLEEKVTAYQSYYAKSLGYRNVSQSEIATILSNSWAIYNLRFFKDKVFPQLVVKDLQMDLYNSGTIINLDIELVSDYNKSLEWKTWDKLKWEQYFKINLNF